MLRRFLCVFFLVQTSLSFAYSSQNIEEFKKLLAQGTHARLEDFLIHWNPESSNRRTREDYWERCTDELLGLPTAFENGKISANCLPEVMYSWGPLQKIRNMEETLNPESTCWDCSPNPGVKTPFLKRVLLPFVTRLKQPSGLWVTMSPVSSYPYGLFPVRIQLKAMTAFRPYAGHDPEPMTISVNSNPKFRDFVITNADVIESWSYGTANHYDEIVDDLIRILSGRGVGYVTDLFWKKEILGVRPTDPLLNITVPGFIARVEGQTSPGEKSLKKALLEMIRMILNGEGRVYYAPDLDPYVLPGSGT